MRRRFEGMSRLWAALAAALLVVGSAGVPKSSADDGGDDRVVFCTGTPSCTYKVCFLFGTCKSYTDDSGTRCDCL